MMKSNQESYDQFYESKVFFSPQGKKAKNLKSLLNEESENSEEDFSLSK